MSSLFLHGTKLFGAIRPTAVNSNDFVDPMVMDHILNWLW